LWLGLRLLLEVLPYDMPELLRQLPRIHTRLTRRGFTPTTLSWTL
jgi:hypothetical protein